LWHQLRGWQPDESELSVLRLALNFGSVDTPLMKHNAKQKRGHGQRHIAFIRFKK
jgi:hypothetical protein